MYMFHKHKIAQLHINKTAGTSLKFYLQDLFNEKAEVIHNQHSPLEKAYKFVPADYKIITIIRNPYDRLVSLYSYRKQKYIRKHKKIPLTPNVCNMDFKNWFLKDVMMCYKKGSTVDLPISENILIDGKIPTNLNIYKMEHIQRGVNNFLNSIDISVHKKFPHRNKTKHFQYLHYYDDELLDLVYKWDRFVFDKFYPRKGKPLRRI